MELTLIRHAIAEDGSDDATRALTPEGLVQHRTSYIAAIRAYHAGEVRRMRSWNLPFLLRHTAYHTMDHAWEMQDKDLSPVSG